MKPDKVDVTVKCEILHTYILATGDGDYQFAW